MPQTNKRMLLTLQPETYNVVKRWASAQGKPMATCVTSLLDEQRPMLMAMTQALEEANAGKTTEALRSMQSMTGRALGLLGAAMEGRKSKSMTGALGLIGAVRENKKSSVGARGLIGAAMQGKKHK